MNTIIKLQKRGTVTVPKKTRELWQVEDGDFLNAEIKEDKIILRPYTVVDKDIIESSKKALSELKAKSISGPFSSMDDFEKFLAKK